MIRLLMLIPTLDASGAEKQFTLLATGLPRDRIEPHVAVLTRSGPYERELRRADVPVTVLGKRFKADPLAYCKLKRLIRRLKPDLLHTWLFAANAYGRLAVPTPPPKVIVSERCVDSWKSSWQLDLDRRLIPRTAALVGNSQSVVDFYAEQGVPSALMHVIPNAVATPGAMTEDRARLRQEVRRELGVPEDARLVLSVGRLARQKRVDVLIWATQLLRQLTENVFHVIVGAGEQRGKLEGLARHFTCDHVTRFLGHRQDTDRLMAAADVFWIASDFEGQSNSLMEAMARGLPVIASDIPANRELIEDGRTGLLVRPGDSVAFAQYADRLLADGEWSRRLGEAARERMETRHSIAAMVDGYARLYESIASNAAPSEPVAPPRAGD